jgi:hypothetical protein
VKRLQNLGLVVLLLAVVGLIGSSVMGIGGKPVPAVAVRTASGPVAEPLANRIRVEVLNASGRPGLARDVMRYLRDRGFDVVVVGNAVPANGTATRVLDRVRNAKAAREVADSLGIASVVTAPDATLTVDASVVLGRDWKMPGAPVDTSAAATTSAAAVDSAAVAPAAPLKRPAPASAKPTPPAHPKATAPMHSKSIAPLRATRPPATSPVRRKP